MTADFRIGLGIDLHRLAAGRPMKLAGVAIQNGTGPVAHSDGDVVLHAACDAVLGAAGLDDLGTLFPETAPENQGRDSADFCREALRRARQKGLRVHSLDVVVETELPKLRPHRAALRQGLADLFGVDVDHVNVKGKTAEGLDAIGAGAAIRATVVALLTTIAPPSPA
jgi:2-C-methyl-D-erythritol 2,4-cyclodiphosphate synthase